MKFVKGMDLSTLRETREKAFSTGSRHGFRFRDQDGQPKHP